jgi:hypothetical protein
VVRRCAKYPLANIRRIAQNRTGGHRTGHTTDCAAVLRQVEGDRGGRFIVIGGRNVFLFLYGHELAFDSALRASFASLASEIGGGALRGAI